MGCLSMDVFRRAALLFMRRSRRMNKDRARARICREADGGLKHPGNRNLNGLAVAPIMQLSPDFFSIWIFYVFIDLESGFGTFNGFSSVAKLIQC